MYIRFSRPLRIGSDTNFLNLIRVCLLQTFLAFHRSHGNGRLFYYTLYTTDQIYNFS